MACHTILNGSWLYYETPDFASKLLQIKTGLYTNKSHNQM